MKKFSEYIKNENDFLNESFLNDISKFFAGNAGKAIGGAKKFWQELGGLPSKTAAIYRITMKSISDITDPKEKRNVQRLLNSYDSCKNSEEIINKNLEYLKNNDNKDSKFNTGLAKISLDIATKLNNDKLEDEFEKILSSQDPEVRKDIASDIKDNTPTEKKDDNTQDSEQKIEKTINTDPIKELSKEANIDLSKLEQGVYSMMIDKDGEIKWDLENANDVVKGLSAIICGGMLIKNEEVRGKILRACGIKFDKEFIEKISNKVE